MGEVFRARDTRLAREVAIKLLPASMANDPDWLRRFQQEAQAAGTLNHPNLVTIHDVGTSEGVPYLCMELLDGETLRTKLADGAHIPLRKTIDYATQIAAGLAAAHEKGIVHRDLKPENIFITRDGRMKILDFGLAKLATPLEEPLTRAQTQARGTSPGTVMGTVGYMSPEQVRGQAVDHRSDIFSFGAILYEMLSGKRAFYGDSPADTMSAILHEEPPELHGTNPNVSPGVDRIIRHCLEKNPEERFQSARDVAFDLQNISSLSGPATILAPHGAISKPGVALTAAIVGIILGAAATTLLKSRAVRSQPRTLTRLTFQTGVERYPSISPDGKTFLYVSDATGNADIFLQRVDGRNAINLTKDSHVDNIQPAFSPDGAHIAFRSERNGGGIFIMGATGESVRRLTDVGFNPSWSADGTEIVFAPESVDLNPRDRSGYGGLWIVSVTTGTVRLLTKHDAVQPSWSPHGDRIAFWGLVGEGGQRDIWTIAAHDPHPDTTIVPVTSDAPLDWNPFWSGDGKFLYLGSDRDGTMNLWRTRIDERTGKTSGALQPLNLPTEFAAHFSAARTASMIAFSSVATSFAIDRYPLDPTTGKSTGMPGTVFSGSLPFADFDVSPDGREIAFATRGQHDDLFVMNTDGSNLRQTTNAPAKDRGPSWSRDGTHIYFFSQRGSRYEVWSILPDGSGLTQVTHTPNSLGSMWYPRQSPDGSRLLLFNSTGSYVFWLDHPHFEALPRIDADHLFMAPMWSPDGRSILGLSVRVADQSKTDGVARYSFATNSYEHISDEGPDPSLGTPVWLPDGKHVIYAFKERLVLVDLATKRRGPLTPRIPGLQDIAMARDGSLYIRRLHTEADVWLMNQQDQ